MTTPRPARAQHPAVVLMPAPHGPRRARIACSDSAAEQVDVVTSEAELHALDRALVVISVDPEAGAPRPGDNAARDCGSTPLTSNAFVSRPGSQR
ncbi:hypothetical protein [Streptomyces longwoodensis]|uniref:hypothetical protein n=1 Tax=Streptomyces longwoodensis TaxID=68231 RepID=UPI003F4CD8CE